MKKLILTLKGHSASVNTVIAIPNTTYLASGSDDKSIIIWDYMSEQKILTFNGHSDRVSSIDVIPNTTYIASGSDDETIIIWDYKKGSIVQCDNNQESSNITFIDIKSEFPAMVAIPSTEYFAVVGENKSIDI